MNVKFEIWGFLPVIYGKSSDMWGRAYGTYVQLPENPSKMLVEHEKFHVKQFYAFVFLLVAAVVIGAASGFLIPAGMFVILVSVLWRLPFIRIRLETAAYGESVRVAESQGDSVDEWIWHYANVLDNSKQYAYADHSYVKYRKMIRKRYEDGRLF